MVLKLRELIRLVRDCKTTNEERLVISKESADIRDCLKQGKFPARCVSKLMYIHMLGYPTQFGQMGCITLLSSKEYNEKRVAYLGLMILLDENQEVLTLVENLFKK
jgi:AP-1 complex subunit gamma-1